MKIVLDTNVLVSGLLSPFGPPARIINLVALGLIELCYDNRILAEYRTVLLRDKFRFRDEDVDSLLAQIRIDGDFITAPKPLLKTLPDAEDEMFLEIALAADAKCLVTGNTKHFPEKCRQGMAVYAPAQFLNVYFKEA